MIQIPPIFFKMHRILRFHNPFCEHALFIFYVQILGKKNKRFRNDFNREYDIFEVPIKHPSHGWFKIELLVNVIVFVNSLIYSKFTKIAISHNDMHIIST